jgi:hypothetical protein
MDHFRLAIEEMILSSFLFQEFNNELDLMEYKDFKLAYDLFRANRTTKLVAKAIRNLQEEDQVVSDLTVLEYIEQRTKFDQDEMISLLSKNGVTFDTMVKYLNRLREMEKEHSKHNILKGLQ